ncbi:MAG: glutamate racemase [Flavobacteriales bacterium]|nr:glutamate racemase [Flavobacteriales bacterium]MDW8431419.1 glutamate racemase [Flavobacteriales bacterium]
MNADPIIGIFDSGVGGLTVLKAIRSCLPEIPVVYYGDTAHMPYGDKSPDLIRSYTRRIVRFLVDRGASHIVIACNSASAVAGDIARQEAGSRVPVTDVVEPVVQEVAQRSRLHCVGIIGTRATIQSGIYQKHLAALRPDLDVRSLATPLLAPLVEEGFAGTPVAREVIRHYLKNELFRPIECLIPACTHYPFLFEDLNDFFWGRVTILDTPHIVAHAVQKQLSDRIVSRQNKQSESPVQVHFSMDTLSFRQLCRLFLGSDQEITESPLSSLPD